MASRRAVFAAAVAALTTGGAIMRADDLAPLLVQAPAPGVGFRQGVIETWDPITAENTVRVAGAVLTNLPTIASSAEVLDMRPGDVVGIQVVGNGAASTMYIVGRIVVPGTPQAASAMAHVASRVVTALVDTAEARTADTGYGDLATVGPVCSDVLVSASGKMIVMMSTAIAYGFTGAGNGGGLMAFEISGATSVGTADRASVTSFDTLPGTSSLLQRQAAVITVSGLNPGLHTVTAKYRAITVNATFSGRHMTCFGL